MSSEQIFALGVIPSSEKILTLRLALLHLHLVKDVPAQEVDVREARGPHPRQIFIFNLEALLPEFVNDPSYMHGVEHDQGLSPDRTLLANP